MRFIHIISFIMLLASCAVKTETKNDVKGEMPKDTLKYSFKTNDLLKDSLSFKLLTSFYFSHGIMISHYYEVIDSISLDLNSDNINDDVLIVSPISLDDPSYYKPMVDSLPKRLLVEIIKATDKSTIRNKYSNLISDVGGVLFNYSGISKTKDGFKIQHEAGNKARWVYSVELTANKSDSLSISKIIKECSYEDKIETQEYKFNNLSISKFNLQDTLNSDCGCEKVWSLIMRK